MNRTHKSAVIASLKTAFEKSSAAFLVNIQGLTVGQVMGLRKELRSHGATMHVAKNTLLRIATTNNGAAAGLEPYFKNQIAIVFATDSAPAVAKVLSTKAGQIEKLGISAGLFEGAVIDARRVQFIASLPSREVLIAQLCGVLLSPVAQIASVLKQVSEKTNTPS
jgi:large subunit ribosomal protein L10